MAMKRPADGWQFTRTTEHPGEILREEFLVPLKLTANALALKLHISPPRLHEILHGRRSITPDTAMRLSRFFGNSAQFWLNLQSTHDLSKAQQESWPAIQREVDPMSKQEAS